MYYASAAALSRPSRGDCNRQSKGFPPLGSANTTAQVSGDSFPAIEDHKACTACSPLPFKTSRASRFAPRPTA